MKRSLILAVMMALIAVLMVSASNDADRDAVENTVENDFDSVRITLVVYKPPQDAEAEPPSAAPDNGIAILHEIKENETADSDNETETEIMYYTEKEVIMCAKLLWRECRGVPSITEKACVLWALLNRVDSPEFRGNTITEVMTVPYQFAYSYETPVWDELYDLSLDVLSRWNTERNGGVSVGRVLPKDYCYYTGDGVHNYFRNRYTGKYQIWDYSLPSPYES